MRLPTNGDLGVLAEVEHAFNALITQGAALAEELHRVHRVVAIEGKTTERATLGPVTGAWATSLDSINSIIECMAWPAVAATEVLQLVDEGDLSRDMSAHRDGTPLQGDFRQLALTVRSVVARLRHVSSAVSEVAREMGSQGKLGGQASAEGLTGTWKTLVEDVNLLTGNLTAQVRNIALVSTEIYRQRMQIESSLREKEILLREIHHRVKNNLQIISSLLNLQASRQSDDVKALFVETNARVRSIALVHEQLNRTENLAAIDINGYISALTSGLVQTYESLRTQVAVDATSTDVTIDVAIPIGLIVNELVSNALKYAFPGDRTGKIEVSLTEQTTTLTLEVRDNGVGIPEHVDPKAASTMGLQLVRSLADQLDGKVSFERDHGTLVRIVYPKPSR